MNRRLDQLTMTRFIAAIVVVAFHFGQTAWPFNNPTLIPILRAGPQAVTYFYVLSGFIMATVHHDLEWNQTFDYWAARISRIYPVYLFGIVSILLLGIPVSNLDKILNILLLQAWVPGHALALNSVGWSLSVEIFFYALFPALIKLMRRAHVFFWCFGALVFWALGQIWTGIILDNFYGGYPSPSHDLIYYFPIVHLGSFLSGMTAATLMRRGVVRLGARSAGAVVVLTGFLIVYGLRNEQLIAGWTKIHVSTATGLLSPAFSLLIVSLCSLEAPLLRSRPLVLLGQASYSMYIMQLPIYIAYMKMGLNSPGSLSFWIFTFVLVGVSCVVFAVIETPCRRWVRAGASMLERAYLDAQNRRLRSSMRLP